MNLKRETAGDRARSPASRETGAVMLEFVIAFPLVLVLTFACIQFAHIWVAKMVVHYAAFCAARSALVCTKGEYRSASGPLKAAQDVCDLVGKGVLRQKEAVIEDGPAWNVRATVKEDLSLFAPIVGPIIAWGMNPWDQNAPWDTPEKSGGNTDSVGFPTITLTETVYLPKPYVTMVEAGF